MKYYSSALPSVMEDAAACCGRPESRYISPMDIYARDGIFRGLWKAYRLEISSVALHGGIGMLQIAVINESTKITDAEVQAMISPLSQQWNNDLRSIWGVDQASFAFVPKGNAPPTGSWWGVFLDDSDQAGALAYHDLTNEGLPISKVFVKTITADKSSVSVGAIRRTRTRREFSGRVRFAIPWRTIATDTKLEECSFRIL